MGLGLGREVKLEMRLDPAVRGRDSRADTDSTLIEFVGWEISRRQWGTRRQHAGIHTE